MKRLIPLLAALGGALGYVLVRRRRGHEGEFHYDAPQQVRPDDATLVDKVRSEIFRDIAVPKGQININAEEGKIVLRGEVDEPELMEQLVERTRKVQGVEDVENLMHVAANPTQ